MASTWVLLAYTLPHEPSAKRVSVWRKLKRLGALLIHDALWVLPATAATREHFQWLAAEITDMGGDAQVWEAQALLSGQEAALVAQFTAHAEALYAALLHEIHAAGADRAALGKRYLQARARDYFHVPLGEVARAALTETQRGDQG